MSRIGDLPEPGSRTRRYSARPFPAYRYVPGVHPHPTRDPAGHSYAEPSPRLHAPWATESWRDLEDWLYGVDLFNAFYFWEAHEAWEGLWAPLQRSSAPALLLQGLIQIAAALLKVHLRTPRGVRHLSAEGMEKLRRAATAAPRVMGLDLPRVIESFETYFCTAGPDQLPDLKDAPILRLG